MSIYTILSSINHNSHFLKKYITFIEKFKDVHEQYETHHICPKSLFPEFVSLKHFPWNAANLSPRAHYIAHHLLMKVFPESNKMKFAFLCMTGSFSNKYQNRNYKISARTYESTKKEITKLRSELWTNNNPGKSQKAKQKIRSLHGGMGNASPYTKEKQKTTMKERYGVGNAFQIPEVIEKLRLSTIERNKDEEYVKLQSIRIKKSLEEVDRKGSNNSFFGKEHSDETKARISALKTGKKHTRYCCIGCKRELGVNNFTQHSRGCKVKLCVRGQSNCGDNCANFKNTIHLNNSCRKKKETHCKTQNKIQWSQPFVIDHAIPLKQKHNQ